MMFRAYRPLRGFVMVACSFSVLAVQACTKAPPTRKAAPFTIDLATHRQLGPSARTVSLTDPALRIGGSSASKETALGSVYGVLLDAQDRLWVADRAAASIARFDEHGKLVDRIGKKGTGPGEFQSVQLVGWDGDSAVAWDPDLHRITLIPEGAGTPMTGPSGFGPRILFGVGPGRDQVFLDLTRHGQAPPARSAWFSPGPDFEVASQAAPADSPSVVLRLKPEQLYFDGEHALLDPLAYRRSPVVFGNTIAVVGTLGADVLLQSLSGGAPVALDLGNEPGTPFTPQLRIVFEHWMGTGQAIFAPLSDIAERGFPARIPAFDLVVASRDGGALWLRHWESAWSRDTALWEVVTPGGQHLGTVRLPARERVVAVNAQRVATVSYDEKGAAVLSEYANPFAKP